VYASRSANAKVPTKGRHPISKVTANRTAKFRWGRNLVMDPSGWVSTPDEFRLADWESGLSPESQNL
jgi:hypothetical protein